MYFEVAHSRFSCPLLQGSDHLRLDVHRHECATRLCPPCRFSAERARTRAYSILRCSHRRIARSRP